MPSKKVTKPKKIILDATEPEETKMIVIEEENITTKYDLNWYYMREKILSYKRLFKHG